MYNLIDTTMKRKDLVKKLESLVHKRYHKDDFDRLLCKIFDVPKGSIHTNWDAFKDLENELTDYNAMFTTVDVEGITRNNVGDFDVYYLKCTDTYPDMVYVTEVGYEFL